VVYGCIRQGMQDGGHSTRTRTESTVQKHRQTSQRGARCRNPARQVLQHKLNGCSTATVAVHCCTAGYWDATAASMWFTCCRQGPIVPEQVCWLSATQPATLWISCLTRLLPAPLPARRCRPPRCPRRCPPRRCRPPPCPPQQCVPRPALRCRCRRPLQPPLRRLRCRLPPPPLAPHCRCAGLCRWQPLRTMDMWILQGRENLWDALHTCDDRR
jgi:hypothetical protein